MSKIEEALEKNKEESEKKKEPASRPVEESVRKVDHNSKRDTIKDGAKRDYLTIEDQPKVHDPHDSKVSKRDKHITSAIEKKEKETPHAFESLVDHDNASFVAEDTGNAGVISSIMDISNKEREIEKVIPSIKVDSYNVDKRIVAYYDSIGKQTWEGPVMVHFRRLQVSLNKIHTRDMCKVMVFTSATQKEGKSTVALNTALTLCNDKQSKIAFINCDFRKNIANKLLGFNPKKGLTDYLTDEAKIEEIAYNGLVSNFTMIPVGKTLSGICEILSSDKMKQFISYLRECFDYVIMDTPPVLAFPDTTVLAPLADGVVFVVNCKKTRKKVVKRAVEVLHDCKIIGCVMNEGETALGEYYGYGYGYGYGNYYQQD